MSDVIDTDAVRLAIRTYREELKHVLGVQVAAHCEVLADDCDRLHRMNLSLATRNGQLSELLTKFANGRAVELELAIAVMGDWLHSPDDAEVRRVLANALAKQIGGIALAEDWDRMLQVIANGHRPIPERTNDERAVSVV